INEWRELAKGRKVSDPLNSQPHDLGNSQTARELGVDEKAVRNASKIACITPEAKEAARNAGIADNQSKLLKVAGAAPEKQASAVHELAAQRPPEAMKAPLERLSVGTHEAQEPRELTSAEQDQILNLVIRLLKTVDSSHEKKFYKYYFKN